MKPGGGLRVGGDGGLLRGLETGANSRHTMRKVAKDPLLKAMAEAVSLNLRALINIFLCRALRKHELPQP